MFRKIPIKDIELYYTILENGNIIDNETHEYVKYHINHDGYYAVYFKHLKSSFLVHRIIISKFIPNEFDIELLVNHKDLNKLNNNITNLEWVTSKENMIHYVNNINRPIKHKHNLLSDDDIIGCYCDFLNGMKTCDIIEKYNISKATAISIKYKRRYQDILSGLPDIKKQNSNTLLTDDIILKIKYDVENNVKPIDIANKYNISVQTVRDFKNGKIFKEYSTTGKKFLGGEKLTENDVVYILNHKDVDVLILANKYNITIQTIKNIWNRKTWKHIKV